MTDGEGRRTIFRYGAFDLVDEVQDPGGGRTRYAYDHEQQLIRVENQLGRIWTFERDAAGDVVAETDFDGLTTRYSRDRVGREVERLQSDGSRLASFYDRSGLLVRQEAWEPRATGPEVTRYRYDGCGLLVEAENSVSRVMLERDGVGRVIAETADGRPVESAYDCCGNRVERRIGTQVVACAFEPLGALSRVAIDDHAPLNFSWDARGRELGRWSEAGFRLHQEWDSVGQLKRQSSGAGQRRRGGLERRP